MLSLSLSVLSSWPALTLYVGAALFKRTPKGLLLTDAAQTALPALREAFDRLAEAASLLTAAVDGRRLTVSVAPSFAAKWLMPRLDRFHEALVVWTRRRPALRSLDGLLAAGIRAHCPAKTFGPER